MLSGIVMGRTIWNIDVRYSKFWTPEKYGVRFPKVIEKPVDLVNFKIDKKYKFILVSDIFSKKTRLAIESARRRGLKVFFLPREPFCLQESFLFKDPRMRDDNGDHYLTPDVVLAPGEAFGNLWKDKTKVFVTGHPKFDYCLYKNWKKREDVVKKYELSENKKILFFPSYTIFHTKEFYKDMTSLLYDDIFEERECLMESLEEFANNRDDIQVVVKLHPMSSKLLIKKGVTKDGKGLTMKYLKNPTDSFKVVDGAREARISSRDIMSAADFVVGSQSTMLYESAVLGKPTLQTGFGKAGKNLYTIPGYEDMFVNSFGKEDTVDKLHKMVDDNVINYKIPGNKYLYLDAGVCERICNVIKQECGG